jgi:hypothetical protein
MRLTIGNYIDKSEGIDFSQLDKGDFFKMKHPEIKSIIKNMDDIDNDADKQRVENILQSYLKRLNEDISANPLAFREDEPSSGKRTTKLKNLKTKKLVSPKRERKEKPSKPAREPKQRIRKEPRVKNKKPKYKQGQVFYEYKGDNIIRKATIKSFEHSDSGEPVYITDDNLRTKEGIMTALIKSKNASIDKPLPHHSEKVPVEVGFLRRFVALDGKTKTHDEILVMLKSLQMAIVERRIRKSSPYASQIDYMQDGLLRLEDASKSGSILVEFPKPKLEELKALASGVATMPAVQTIKAFLKLQGKTGVKEESRKLFEKISSARPYLNASNSLHAQLKVIARSLDDYISGNSHKVMVTSAELNGLMGLAGIDGLDSKSTIKVKSGTAMRSTDFAQKDFYPMGLSGKWKQLLGDVCEPFRLMVYGKGGSGKSTLSLELAHYLADQMGKTVLFVANEEGFGATLKEKLKRLNAAHPDLFVVDELPSDLSRYDIVFLDSADSLRLTPDQVNRLCKKCPKLSLVSIHKVTKAGSFRGSAEWEHDCDTSVVVADGVAKAGKNRFGGRGEVRVF